FDVNGAPYPVPTPYPTLTVPGATVVKVASSDQNSTYGQSVTFTATVIELSGTGLVPTGNVQFVIDGADFGSAMPLQNGAAYVTTAALTAGSHSIVAHYTGEAGKFGCSWSASATQLVSRAKLIVTADDQTMVYGSAPPDLTVSYKGFVNGNTAG